MLAELTKRTIATNAVHCDISAARMDHFGVQLDQLPQTASVGHPLPGQLIQLFAKVPH